MKRTPGFKLFATMPRGGEIRHISVGPDLMGNDCLLVRMQDGTVFAVNSDGTPTDITNRDAA